MSRFVIEDIVSQDKRGIIFLAHDAELGHPIALRRFFPFGQDGGGLSVEESHAFQVAAQRLAGVTHPALRSLLDGAVDPIDGMPYIVGEWVDGASLDAVLRGETLDPRLVAELLRIALELSLALSETLGEEAVWVEAEADSIFVGSEESGKGFVFWLSPFKWLGAEFSSRKLAAIVDLGERLTGWKGKIYGDHAGCGLGAWLKWMRNNPDAGLAQALETLPSFITGEETPPPPKPTLTAPPDTQPAVKLKQPSVISPVVIVACASLLLAVGGLAYYHKSASAPAPPQQYAEQPVAKAPPAAAQIALHNFAPGDGDKIKALKANSPASVTGVVQNVRLSGKGNCLYFEFSKPPDSSEIAACAHKKDYQDNFTDSAYKDLIGKKLRFDGTVFREPSGRQFVKISSRKGFKVVE